MTPWTLKVRAIRLGLATAFLLGVPAHSQPGTYFATPEDDVVTLVHVLHAAGTCPDIWVSGEKTIEEIGRITTAARWSEDKLRTLMLDAARTAKAKKEKDFAAFCTDTLHLFWLMRGELRRRGIID